MNKTDRDNWRKFLGIKDPQTALDAARIGGDIGKTAGRAGGSVGGGSFDGENPPEGEDEEGAEKGDGGADAGEKLKVGDKFDRLEDLYDCETGEEVTIDGFGEKGSEKYPSGFQDCKDSSIPDDYVDGYYFRSYGGFSKRPKDGDWESIFDRPRKSFQRKSEAISYAVSGVTPKSPNPNDNANRIGRGEYTEGSIGLYMIGDDSYSFTGGLNIYSCLNYDPICDLPPPKPKWPAVDKNHLVWNKEKNCFEPLCPELNTQVLDKYKGCEDERILCDADGNKVKVKVDGDVVKVTQEKYGQTAEIKNGKVQTVKKLTESQTEAEFK